MPRPEQRAFQTSNGIWTHVFAWPSFELVKLLQTKQASKAKTQIKVSIKQCKSRANSQMYGDLYASARAPDRQTKNNSGV